MGSGVFEKRLEHVGRADLARRRNLVAPVRHALIEELKDFLLGVLALGRRALDELVLPAFAAPAKLNDPPAIVFSEERLLRHCCGIRLEHAVNRKGLAATGPRTSEGCYKNLLQIFRFSGQKQIGGVAVTPCYVGSSENVGATGFEPATS